MRYAKINPIDIANGDGVRVSIFLQGCSRHCKGCFNPSTWDFKAGKYFYKHDMDKLIEYLKPDYIKGLSILGGEPFEQLEDLIALVNTVKQELPNKDIYIWTGYKWEELLQDWKNMLVLVNIDLLVDGEFIAELRDVTLHLRGSSNQRCIDVKESLEQKKLISWRN